MSMKSIIHYKEIDQYKYELAADYQVHVKIKPEAGIHQDYFSLTTGGLLTIKAGYMWDGPSGPAIDTPNFMRGSLIHDVFYQCMRSGWLGQTYRQTADEELSRICLEDGMSKIRAWWVYNSVRMFAADCARRKANLPEYKILTAP
jgi:hypothetical protein